MNPAWVAFWGGLGGAVIGASASVITTLVVLRAERKNRAEERQHEDETRFHRERARLYAEFEAAASKLFTHHHAVGLGLVPAPVRFQQLLESLTDANARVSYVATSPVTVSAATLLETLAVDEGQVNVRRYGVLLGEFKLAARNELGVNPDESAQESQ